MNNAIISGSTAKFLHIVSTATETTEKTIALIPTTKDDLFDALFSLYAAIASQENAQRVQYTKLICGHFFGIIQAIAAALWVTVKNDDLIPVLLQFASLIRQGLSDETSGVVESIELSSDATEDVTEELAEEAIEPTTANPVVSSENAIESTPVAPKNSARKSEGVRSKRMPKKKTGFVKAIG